jgi:hypothetical protein
MGFPSMNRCATLPMIALTGNRAMLRLVLTGLVFELGLFDRSIGLGFALHVLLLVWAWRVLPHHWVKEITS